MTDQHDDCRAEITRLRREAEGFRGDAVILGAELKSAQAWLDRLTREAEAAKARTKAVIQEWQDEAADLKALTCVVVDQHTASPYCATHKRMARDCAPPAKVTT